MAVWDVEGMVLLTIEEAASRTRLSPRTIRRMIKSRLIQAHPFGSGTQRHQWRIPEEALTLQQRPAEPVPPAAAQAVLPSPQQIMEVKRRLKQRRSTRPFAPAAK